MHPVIEVTRVDYIRVPVDDIEKAKHFYGEVLGLPQNTHLDHEDWIEYEASNLTLAVMTPHTHDYEFAALPPATIALGVPDVAAAKAQLEAGRPRGRRPVGFRRLQRRRRQRPGREPHPPPPPVQVV
jgi:catechol 2,3-dioxygenase-like lactoylglutathione lyase family enzyme